MQEFQYFRPETLNQAKDFLDKYGKDVKILAGGTDLIIALRDKTIVCKYVMDIKAIKELQIISYSDSEGLSIGSAVCLNEIIYSNDIKNHYPILVESAKTLANSLLRNRATIVGNICNASPGGDMISPSIVLDARIEIVSKQKTRTMPLKDFILGVKRTALKENELVTKINFPKIVGKGKYLRKSRIKGHDLAQVSVAAFLTEAGGLKLSIGAAGPTPIIVEGFENYKKVDLQSNKQEIIKKVMNEVKPIGDQRASKEYRIAMIKYLLTQIFEELEKEA